jgi:hypothetical protein
LEKDLLASLAKASGSLLAVYAIFKSVDVVDPKASVRARFDQPPALKFCEDSAQGLNT